MRNLSRSTRLLKPCRDAGRSRSARSLVSRGRFPLTAALLLLLFSLVAPLQGREHKVKSDYRTGFSTEISAPEAMVLQAVDAVVNDGIIQGSKEYNKDKFIDNATSATSSQLFPEWTGGGKVYYKVRAKVLAPVNFIETQDEGTLAVRYIVQSKSTTETVLRIDALFEEGFRRTLHPSDGSVENAEYRDIQDHVDALELEKKQAEEGERNRQEQLAKQALQKAAEQDRESTLAAARASGQTPEQHVEELRRQVERIIKASGAQLKSAPFHSATNLKSLEAGTRVVILIQTPYWYGVETEDGQHGWVNHSQLDFLP